MGKTTGFLEWERAQAPKRPVAERLQDWLEFELPMAAVEVEKQGGRCMNCGVPFCHQGCPLGNNIPDFNDLVYRKNWKEAYHTLAETNNFPELTGRLCPAPCEAACVLAINRPAVSIELIEKSIIEYAFDQGWVTPRPPAERTGKTVAIVGSGPAGLAAAAQLNQAGHSVTVFEQSARPGGLLRYGIPDFKLEKGIVERRLGLMTAEGIAFRTGVTVGLEPRWDVLRESFDAIIIAVGAGVPRDLPVPGRDLDGVHLAMDFLAQQNRRVSGEAAGAPEITASGKRVIVLGGGDTGSDCLGTALRQGAKSVLQIELLPEPPRARGTRNPWPQWPMTLRTSSSHEEGGDRRFSILTKALRGVAGKLAALQAVEVDVQNRNGGGLTFAERPGSELEIGVDLLLVAMGFVGADVKTLVGQLGVALDERGAIKTTGGYSTSVPGVFAAGDARRGASLVVWAISEGREAGRAADSYLAGRPSALRSRGADFSFGGR
ncbi:MAG: glutamate synthase subunit beta [Candidatus Schekmanbacteria bacterium]|nr:glutamate synthase subunit beta [Candidatus Schekmanbacteria bacterium]